MFCSVTFLPLSLYFLFSAVLPPNIYRPDDLDEGAWVMAIGKLTAFAHPNLYLVIEVNFIRSLYMGF